MATPMVILEVISRGTKGITRVYPGDTPEAIKGERGATKGIPRGYEGDTTGIPMEYQTRVKSMGTTDVARDIAWGNQGDIRRIPGEYEGNNER